jgi:hypothetical protein
MQPDQLILDDIREFAAAVFSIPAWTRYTPGVLLGTNIRLAWPLESGFSQPGALLRTVHFPEVHILKTI